jgi:hypothetical protein
MTSTELENLVRVGQLKREPPSAGELMLDGANAVLVALRAAGPPPAP